MKWRYVTLNPQTNLTINLKHLNTSILVCLKHLHSYLSENNYFSADFLKSGVTGNLEITEILLTRISVIRQNPLFLISEDQQKNFVFAKRRQVEIFQPNRYVNFCWSDKSWNNPWGSAAQFFHLVTQKLMQTSWFQTNIAVRLWGNTKPLGKEAFYVKKLKKR